MSVARLTASGCSLMRPKLFDVGFRSSAVARDKRCHAHSYEVLCIGLLVNGLDVRVYVYEAGRNDCAVCVYNFTRQTGINVAYASDASIANCHIGAKPRVARPVNDATVRD